MRKTNLSRCFLSKVPDLVCVSWNINLVPWSSYYCNEKKVDIYHKSGLVENCGIAGENRPSGGRNEK